MVSQLPPKLDESKSSIDEMSVELDELINEDDAPLVERGTIPELTAKQVPGYLANFLSNVLVPQELSGAMRWFYRPLLFTAVGLHLLLFFGPSASNEEKKVPEKKEKPVTITKISTGKAANKKPAPKLQVKAKPKLPKVKLAQPKAPIIKPSPKPTPTPQAAVKPQPTPQASPSPLPSVSPLPPGGDNKSPNDPFADFPHIGIKNEADEYIASGKSVAQVAAHFKQELPARKYSVTSGVETPERLVIEVEKGGKSGYLNIFQDGADVVYVIAGSEIESLAMLRGANSVPGSFVALVQDLPEPAGVSNGAESGTPIPDDFADPSLFFKNVENEDFKDNIGGVNPRMIDYDADLLFEEMIAPGLSTFKVTKVAPYGGGNVWKLQQGKTELFLNLVPSQTNRGVSVIVWTSQPG